MREKAKSDMAAQETFEWFVSTMTSNPDQDTVTFIGELREYLNTLRSEDERQRFVDDVITELKHRMSIQPSSIGNSKKN